MQKWSSWTLSFLAGHGGEEEGSVGVALFYRYRRVLSQWSYFDEHNHAIDFGVIAIFSRYGGMNSTSVWEALIWMLGWGSTTLRRQVVRPRCRSSCRLSSSFVGARRSSLLASVLGGDAWRILARCGGDTQGPD